MFGDVIISTHNLKRKKNEIKKKKAKEKRNSGRIKMKGGTKYGVPTVGTQMGVF